MAGYSFARYKIGGFHLPFWVLSIRMMPPVAAIVPLFILMFKLKINRYAFSNNYNTLTRNIALCYLDDARIFY